MAYRNKARPAAPAPGLRGGRRRARFYDHHVVVSARSALSAMGAGALLSSPVAICAAAYLDSIPLGLICGGLGFVTTAPLLAR